MPSAVRLLLLAVCCCAWWSAAEVHAQSASYPTTPTPEAEETILLTAAWDDALRHDEAPPLVAVDPVPSPDADGDLLPPPTAEEPEYDFGMDEEPPADFRPSGSNACPAALCYDPRPGLAHAPLLVSPRESYTWQLLPQGVMYRSYLASTKEARFGSRWLHDAGYGNLWEVSLGGRAAIVRYGTQDPLHPEGFEVDLEGAAMPRLDPWEESAPLISTDYRFGIPVTWCYGSWQFKTGYTHLSSHLGDEYMLLNPGVTRINYSRDSILFGLGYYWNSALRLYGELDYAPSAVGGADPVALLFGFDYSPLAPSRSLWGDPYCALNCHLRQEVDFGGHFCAQYGRQWRGLSGHLFRIGLEYVNGKTDQYEFFRTAEEKLGFGIYYDF